jgi:hypothetical protein
MTYKVTNGVLILNETYTGCLKTAAKTLQNIIKYSYVILNKSLKHFFCMSSEDKELQRLEQRDYVFKF